MAHFALVFALNEAFVDTEAHERTAREMVEKAGHTCAVWRRDTATYSLWRFIREQLRTGAPLCIVYKGHGTKWGWRYKTGMLYPYWLLAWQIAAVREQRITAIINDTCHGGAIAEWLKRTRFRRKKTIVLSSSISERTTYADDIFEFTHVGTMLHDWFVARKPFDPFEYEHNVQDSSIERGGWPHWRREGPERYGSQNIDEHFFSVPRETDS